MNSTTTLFQIHIKEDPAIVVLTENDNGMARIEVACRTNSYRADLRDDLPPVQFLPDSTSPLECLRKMLQKESSSCDGYQTTYEGQQDDDASIRIQISQRLPSGLVRVVWQCNLQKTDTMYDFIEQLVQLHQDTTKKQHALQQSFQRLDQDRNDWKDTAEKLEHVWQQEKSELLQNFLTLYQKQQELTAQAQNEVRQLQEKLLEQQQQAASQKATKKNKANTLSLNNEPDDMDHELYPQELVEELAGGKKRAEKKRPTTTTTAVVLPKKRRNHATGAMEYFDTDQVLEDLGNDMIESGKNHSQPAETTGNSYSAPKKTKEPPKKKAAPKKKQKQDDSSTDSAYSYSELSSDVLAQLAVMKNMD